MHAAEDTDDLGEPNSQAIGYPEESIGRMITSPYLAVQPHSTVRETLRHIRKHGGACKSLHRVYVVDEDGILIGSLQIKDILLASLDDRVSGLLDRRLISLQATDDQELAVRMFQDYDFVSLPILGPTGELLGIITVDDVMDVAEAESVEDMQKFSSIQQAIVNPLRASVFVLYRKRIVWLTVLVFMNVFSGALIARFETMIQSVVALVFFLPLLIDSGGNAGAQSATLMIRALSMGDVQLRDWLKLVGKEALVSALLGITMASGVALIASVRAPEITLVVTFAMVASVILSSLIGLLLPFVLTKLQFDPATASAPLITSIADITGVLIYFSLAAWYFGF